MRFRHSILIVNVSKYLSCLTEHRFMPTKYTILYYDYGRDNITAVGVKITFDDTR